MKYYIHRAKQLWWTIEAYPNGRYKCVSGDVFGGVKWTYWEDKSGMISIVAKRLLLGYEEVDKVTFKMFLGPAPLEIVT